MKHFHYLFLLVFPALLPAQQEPQLSRYTIALELGSGQAGQAGCYDNWGYFQMGLAAEHRFNRSISLGASLHYMHLEGRTYGYSNGAQYSLHGFQQLNNVILLFGPALHFPNAKGWEFSLVPKAGPMLNLTTQEISNYGSLYQVRQYKPGITLVYEANLRISRWLTNRLAFETGIGYSSSLKNGKALELASVTGKPNPEDHQVLPEYFLENITADRPNWFALNLTLGLRLRL